jgi:hypothetical protein
MEFVNKMWNPVDKFSCCFQQVSRMHSPRVRPFSAIGSACFLLALTKEGRASVLFFFRSAFRYAIFFKSRRAFICEKELSPWNGPPRSTKKLI